MCEKCLRCSDCCECEIALEAPVQQMARVVFRAVHGAETQVPDIDPDPEPQGPPPGPDPWPPEEPEPGPIVP
jgi:hypothetical protein